MYKVARCLIYARFASCGENGRNFLKLKVLIFKYCFKIKKKKYLNLILVKKLM
jgi:hypothetical protein